MKSYKHSGAFGDLIYGLALARHFGPGRFYLHLDQINWIGQHYYGSMPNPVHQGRLNQKDFEFIRGFLLAQDYITEVDVMNRSAEITHNLDRFRPLFVGHPGNYVDIYSTAFGIIDPLQQLKIRTTPWLTVGAPKRLPGKTTVINRTARWLPPSISDHWTHWREQGLEADSVFVGLPEEHQAFEQATGWKVDYQPVSSMLEMAELIAGAEQFIGNQSMALAVAIGLGRPYWCEYRRDLPLARNECYFPNQPGGEYF